MKREPVVTSDLHLPGIVAVSRGVWVKAADEGESGNKEFDVWASGPKWNRVSATSTPRPTGSACRSW